MTTNPPQIDQDVYLETPVINEKKTIQVVYSNDSASSILAAIVLQKLVESIDPDSLAGKTHGVTITEVGDLLIRDVADSYIWLDMPRIDCVDNPIIRDQFDHSEHLELVGYGLGHWMHSAFGEAIERLVEDGEYLTRKMTDTSELILDELRIERTIHYGLLLNAACALSYLIPEMEVGNVREDIIKMSNLQHDLAVFYSKHATTHGVLKMFTVINNAQFALGQVHRPRLQLEINHDPLYKRAMSPTDMAAQMYLEQYRALIKKIETTGLVQKTVVDNRSTWLLTLRLPDNVWLARRIIRLTTGYRFHNTRATVFGTHSTSNVQGRLGEVYLRDLKTSTR